eukprot:scaffold109664_cov36-Prasinocladus_malaysianus.AAC.1
MECSNVMTISHEWKGEARCEFTSSTVAAEQEDTADAALGNVTGSNCVNVFLGIGLPWTIAAIYQSAVLGQDFVAESPGFVEGVIIFAVCATICLATL